MAPWVILRWKPISPNTPDLKGIFLETAHPVKFYDSVEPIIGQKVPLPDEIKMLLGKEKHSLKMEVKYEALENYLLMKQ